MSRNSYISLDEAKRITGRSDTTLLRWHRAGHVRRRMLRGRPYYHAEDLRLRLAELATMEATLAQQADPTGTASTIQNQQGTLAAAANVVPDTIGNSLPEHLIDQIAELRAERDYLRQQIADRTQSEASITRDRDQLRVDLRLAQAAQVEAESQYARTFPVFAELQALLDRASIDLAQVQRQRDQILAQLQVAERERNQYQREGEPLRQAVDELEAVKARLLDDLRQITAQMGEQQRQFSVLKRDKEILNAELIWLDNLIKTMLADSLLAVKKSEYQRRYDLGKSPG